MGKFKVGDRVRVKADYGTCLLQAGGEYEVLHYRHEGEPVVAVYDLGGARHELDYSDDHFELVEQPWQPKVGDRVRLVKDGLSTTGAIGKAATIERIYDGEDWPILLNIDPPVDYETIAASAQHTRARTYQLEPLPVAAEAKPALRIEAGKFYKTRDGRKVGPLRTWPDLDGNPYPDRLCEVHGDGRYWLLDGSGSGDSDIIAEWADEPGAAVAATASNDNAPVAEQPAYKVGDKVRSPVDWCDTTVGDILSVESVTAYGTYLSFDEIEPAPQQSTAGFTIPLVEDEPAVEKDGSTQLTVRITSDFTELHEQIDYAFERLRKLKKKASKLGIDLDFAKAA